MTCHIRLLDIYLLFVGRCPLKILIFNFALLVSRLFCCRCSRSLVVETEMRLYNKSMSSASGILFYSLWQLIGTEHRQIIRKKFHAYKAFKNKSDSSIILQMENRHLFVSPICQDLYKKKYKWEKKVFFKPRDNRSRKYLVLWPILLRNKTFGNEIPILMKCLGAGGRLLGKNYF